MITNAKNNLPDSIRERTAGFFASGGALDIACADAPFPFEIRPQQQKMAEAVAEALVESEHLAVEAGTGVGKTFAYFVPLILSAVANGSRVAVSTHTINLQEQIMFKDIPFLRKNIGLDFKAALCKGRSNYLCLRRLASANLMSGDLFNKGAEKELARLRRWANETRDGSLSEWVPDVRDQPVLRSLGEAGMSEVSEGNAECSEGGGQKSKYASRFTLHAQRTPDVWRQVCSEHDNCLGKKCPYYPRCFLMRARAEAFNADLLVLNHHLLFSDLAMRRTGNGILPDFGALVIDEAHNIEDIAGEHLGLRLSQGGIQHWLRRLYTPANGKGLLMALKEFQIADETAKTWDAVDHFFIELASLLQTPSDRHASGPENPIPGSTAGRSRTPAKQKAWRDKLTIKGRLELKSMLAEQIAVLIGNIKKLQEAIEDEAVKAELKAIITRGDEIRQAIEFFRKEPDPNFVCWIENEGARGRLALVSAPVDVAPLLKDMLFNAYAPIIMTSATLSVNESLAYFRGRIGVENCRELIVDSPFDYNRQMKVYIAADMPEPNDAKFPEAVADAVAHFTGKSRGRAFVLFTNAELMRQVAGRLEDFFAAEGLLALVQGEGLPRHAMLKKFREAHIQVEMQNGNGKMDCDDLQSKIATSAPRQAEGPSAPLPATGGDGKNGQPQAGPPVAENSQIGSAVLFGLDSFWMGVDVQGEALSNVIIVRLPFSVPDEPLVKARGDRITAAGGDAFREYSLPQAILKFRQGVGRLIRTATDEGMIVILDPRIISRWYGKYFLKAIPECEVETVRLED